MSKYPNIKKIGILLILFLLLSPVFALAQSASEIQEKINNHNEKIKTLENEIKMYEKQVTTVGEEAKSLQSAIQILDINQKKITTEIKKTETNIEKTNLSITQLGGEIKDVEGKIKTNSLAVGQTFNEIRKIDDRSLIEELLSNKSISDILDEYESITGLREKVREQSAELSLHKDELAVKKSATEKEKGNLLSLKSELGDQNQILTNNKQEKNNLLQTTKNKEATYKKILADKQAEKIRFERELFDFESQLKRAVDPNSFPSPGKGVIFWPLDNITLTQSFGRTVDAKRLYVSGTHNGVDFRASRGTPVKSVLGGTVQAIGNTDEQRGCYSYGKWVLINHPNGLTSLYAHLDLIKVAAGQKVGTGEMIGYSGQTGYATGPHLHFTLYASQGVEVQKYSSSINCKNVSIPIAPSDAYLDPMLYF